MTRQEFQTSATTITWQVQHCCHWNLKKKSPKFCKGNKGFNSLHCNTGIDPVAGKLLITDDFNVLLWQLTSGIQQLITTKLAR